MGIEGKLNQTPAQEKERVPLRELSDAEELERYKDIKSLYEEVDGRDPDRAQYMDFYNNVYKYLDKFKVDDKSGEELRPVFNQAVAGNRVMKRALEVYQEDKKTRLGLPNRKKESIWGLDQILKRYEEESGYKFTDEEGKLNVEQLANLFDWSTKTFIAGGEKIGRKYELPPESVNQMTEDVREILGNVNFYR